MVLTPVAPLHFEFRGLCSTDAGFKKIRKRAVVENFPARWRAGSDECSLCFIPHAYFLQFFVYQSIVKSEVKAYRNLISNVLESSCN